jgi:hypothetical protein
MVNDAPSLLQLHAALTRPGAREFVPVCVSSCKMPQYARSTRVPPSTPEYPPSAVSARAAEQVRAAAAATGLLPLFQTLDLGTDAPSLERAVNWLALQGAQTVADLRELPPGTYTCKDLAEDLGLPLVQAQRLLTALEGTKSSCNPPRARRRSNRFSRLHDRCSAALA